MRQTRRSRWSSAAWLLALLALVAAVWRLVQPPAPAVPPADAAALPQALDALAATAAVHPSVTPPPGASPTTATSAATIHPSVAVPPGVSPAQWAELRAELAQRSDGDAELQRLAEYFAYADAFERFRALREGGAASPALSPLARELDGGLDARLQRNELSVHEAERIKLALLEVLLPDAGQRQHQLALWRHAQQSGTQADTQAAAREADFERRQAAIVASWSALPPAQRNPKLLEEQLETLRQASFGTRDR